MTAGQVPHRQAIAVGKHVPGEPGAWVFIFGDMTVFAIFFATYLYYRGQHTALFNDSQRRLEQGFGVAYTLVLLCSSLAAFFGVAAVRRRREGSAEVLASRYFFAAMACGGIFIGLKTWEYSHKFSAGITPVTNEFYMYYFVLTGIHLFHLLLGLAILAYLARVARRAILTGRQYMFVEAGACYWHMVDLLWIIIFALLYLVK